MEMEWAMVFDFVTNNGFPIFLSIYLLHRMELKLDGVIEALNQLATVITSR